MAPAKQQAATGSKLATTKPAGKLAEQEQIPDYLRTGEAKRGFEEAGREDFVLPRLAICQNLTPQRQKRNTDIYMPDLKEGDFFNTLTGEIYGPSVKVIPLFLTKQRIKFKGKIGEGIDCQSANGKTGGRISPQGCRQCPNAQWGTGKDGQGQACTEFKNIVVLIEGHKEPIMFSTKSTAIKVTKQWLSMMAMSNLDMFSCVYQLDTETTVANDNEFWTYKYARIGFVPKEIYDAAKTFFEGLHDKDVTFNPNDLDEGDLDPAGGDKVPY